MRNYFVILFCLVGIGLKAQITITPDIVTHCLGNYTPVTVSTNVVYDSVHWVSSKGDILGNRDTLIVGPRTAPTTGLQTITLYLYRDGINITTSGTGLTAPSLYVVPIQPFEFKLNNDTTACLEDSITIQVYDPSRSITSIDWYSDRKDFLSPKSGNNPVPLNYKTTKPGKYWVTASDGTGNCKLTDTINIRKVNQPVDLGPDVILCENDGVFLENRNESMLGTRYEWSLNGNLIRTTETYFPTESGNYQLKTISPAPAYCEYSDEVNVNIYPVPQVDLSPNITVCRGEQATISNFATNDGFVYISRWENTTTGSLPIIAPGQESIVVETAGTYKLTLSTDYCDATDSTVVDYFDFEVELGADIPDTCSNGTYNLKNLAVSTEPPVTFYLWRTPYGNFTDRGIVAKERGNYILTVTSDFPQCSITDTVFVALNPIPEFELGQNYLTQESFFTFDGTLNGKFDESQFDFEWTSVNYDSTFSLTSELFLDQPGEYNVELKVTDKFSGCNATDNFLVIIPEEPTISSHVMYIPDAISPLASNQENSRLKVLGPDIDTQNFEFKLFNRWGEIIFETTDFDFMKYEGWGADDTVSDVQNGTYTYTAKGQFKDGKVFSRLGTVSVLR